MLKLKTGDFIDVAKKIRFNVVPFCHKARENEPFVKMLEEYKLDPSDFLFETGNGYLSEIVDYRQIGGRFPMTVKEYNQRVRYWLKQQKPREIWEVPENGAERVFDLEDQFNQLKGVV